MGRKLRVNTSKRCKLRSCHAFFALEVVMENAVFFISMGLGVAAVLLLAFTLLWIALGKVDV
jgi:hypothetical protein